MSDHSIKYHNKNTEPWKVTLIDTGEKTMTGGRLKRISGYIEDEKDFLFTYGDGLADVNLDNLVNHHRKQNTLTTVTAVRPAGRYGALKIKENLVYDFIEKPEGDGGLINVGFFVLKPEVINYIKDDSIAWEEEPLEKLSSENQLSFYEHKVFGNQWIL